MHGGAPSKALDLLDTIGTPENARPYLVDAVTRGEKIMGFGHRVYKTDDPRSLFLRDVAERIQAEKVGFAKQVETTVVDVLAELKPGRNLYANVEFYAGVVMEHCGLPRQLFTPTFASSRVIGWAPTSSSRRRTTGSSVRRRATLARRPPCPSRSREPVNIEIATEASDDLLAAASKLIPQLSRTNPPPNRWQLEEVIASPATDIFVARDDDGEIVGTATLAVFRIPTALRAWIEDVVVDESARGEGVGRALTEAMIERAEALGCATVDLTSRPDREAANEMYTKLGFKQRETNVYRYSLRTRAKLDV